jgi:hypothetical protein
MKGKVTCSCGHSWNKSDSSKKDVNVCHICGKDNTMKNGGSLDKYQQGGNKNSKVNLDDVYTKLGISAKNWIDPKEVAMSKGVAESDAISKAPVKKQLKDVRVDKPTSTISAYNPGLKLTPSQQLEYEKKLKNRERLENVQKALGATEALGIIPTPITEGIGLGSGLLNAGLSSYLAGQDYSAGNYGGMAANLLGAGLSGAGAAAVAPKKVTDIVNTAAKSKNLKELGMYALAGVPPEKSLGRIGKADLKAMRQVQNIRRQAGDSINNNSDILQKALDENIPDLHFEKAFGATKDEVKQTVAQLRAAEEARLLADMEARNSRNAQEQFIEDYSDVEDVSDIDWSQYDEYNDYQNDQASLLRYNNPLPEDVPEWNDVNEINYAGIINDDAKGVQRIVEQKAGEALQNYPYYRGTDIWQTNPTEFLSSIGSTKGFSDRVERGISNTEQLPSGTMITGSLDTSHNSYLPQLKKVFSEGVNQGDPTFFGYRNMNPSGYLSQGSYSPKEIAAYLNTEIDDQIRRNILPSNIQRPYLKDDSVLLPQYGIKKKENGGWLEKYNDGGPVQENYNDYSVSAGPGFEGDGYSNVGRNYSPAWGGQFQMGGSIGGATQGIPGATGFMYARTGTTPSNGKYAKKTKASAQNGKEMQFYQEGLDFKPKSISKKGKEVIKDDMGQWNHPGEITKIGSNQITMQGVPYPVLGISDTGDTQMMYPNQEYQYIGDSVTEYPIMQNGGFLDPLINLGKSAVNYVGGLFEDPAPAPVVKTKASIKPKADAYDTMLDLGFNNPQSAKLKNLYTTNRNKVYLTDKNKVALNTGRFKGANVSAALIDDVAAAAKRNKIPVGQLLALAGRESTFGQQKGNDRAKKDSANNEYMSGWNVAEDYSPYDPHRFLADKKVPGINVVKTPHGYGYEVADEKAVREYLKKHPNLIEQYKKKVATTPDLGNRNYFDLSAEFLKKKGIQGYNPGDPTYVDMFNQDYNTLKQDKELMSYLKKKGYKYEQGGQLTKLDQLSNFTNYNTKQPGGWLDKYQ